MACCSVAVVNISELIWVRFGPTGFTGGGGGLDMKFDDPDPEQEMSVHVKNANAKKMIAAVDAVLGLRKLVLVLVIRGILKLPPQGESVWAL